MHSAEREREREREREGEWALAGQPPTRCPAACLPSARPHRPTPSTRRVVLCCVQCGPSTSSAGCTASCTEWTSRRARLRASCANASIRAWCALLRAVDAVLCCAVLCCAVLCCAACPASDGIPAALHCSTCCIRALVCIAISPPCLPPARLLRACPPSPHCPLHVGGLAARRPPRPAPPRRADCQAGRGCQQPPAARPPEAGQGQGSQAAAEAAAGCSPPNGRQSRQRYGSGDGAALLGQRGPGGRRAEGALLGSCAWAGGADGGMNEIVAFRFDLHE